MNVKFRVALAVSAVFALGFTPLAATAQSADAGEKTTPLSTVIAAVAKRTGKKFIVDPRVRGDALLINESPAALSYDDLLTLLRIHGFVAVNDGDYVSVIPDANARQQALPQAGDGKHLLSEYVNKVVHVKSIPAAYLVPLLRPLLPQQAHLVAMPCTNDLIMVDTYGNVQRLEKLIKSLDRGEPIVPPKCSAAEPVAPVKCSDAKPAGEKQAS